MTYRPQRGDLRVLTLCARVSVDTPSGLAEPRISDRDDPANELERFMA